MTFEKAVQSFAAEKWLTEQRAGVQHFITGQHRAVAVADEEDELLAALAYVPASGHGVLVVPIARDPIEATSLARLAVPYLAVPIAAHILCAMPGAITLPTDFALSDKMREAIDAVLA